MARMREPNYSVRWLAVNAPDQLQADLIKELQINLRDHAKLEAPYKTGQLRNSIIAENGRVVAKAEYALYVHEGTKPHIILPKRGRFLVFPGRDGRLVFTTIVHHPGTKANPFMKRGLQDTKAEAPGITQRVLDRWLQQNRIA